MALRQRLPRLGARLLRGLAAEAEATAAAAPQRAASLQCVRTFSRLAGPRCLRQLASTGAVSVLAARQAPPSALLSLASLRQFAAAADLPAFQDLPMPALSPTMSQGNIVAWKKKEGDQVAPGDILCEVETDKATIEWEAQEEGFLAKILMPEGSKDIPVGTTVALLVEDAGDVAAFANYSPGAGGAAAAAPKKAAAPKEEAAPAAGAPGSFPAHQVLAMPSLSPTMNAGNILGWRKAVGDEVAAGDILAEVETDKATIEWESQDDGFIAQILVPEGTSGISVGTPVLVITDSKEDVPAFAAFTAADAGGAAAPKVEAAAPAAAAPAAPAAPVAAPAAAPAAAAPQPAVQAAAPGGRVIASPYARKLAAQAGVSLAGAPGSGPGGRIVAADVQQLIASGGAAPAPAVGAAPEAAYAYATYTDIPNSQIRKVTARRLLESKQQVPHYYLTISARVDRLQQLRQQLNASLASSGGGKLSLNDFVIKASALALRKVPEVNASWFPDFIRQYHTVDCSVAVQTPLGLMVPIVRDADMKGLAAIAGEVKELAGRAKEGKLRPEEFMGGTFTISNLGMYGVQQFAAIVNPPQACILAVGTTEARVVPSATAPSGFEEANFLTCTLSCDHRVVDGAVGAQWLQAFKSYLEDPATMLL